MKSWCLAMLLSCVMVISGCTSTSSQQKAEPIIADEALVVFTPQTAYTQALETVTTLGLQPAIICGLPPSESNRQIIWQPEGQTSQFAATAQLVVKTTYLAPADWRQRLTASISILSLRPPTITTCPIVTPATTSFLTPMRNSGPLVYQRVTFTAATKYGDALSVISNLGLRLANPCYEAQWLANADPAWQPMTQTDAYIASHSLLISPVAGLASTAWQQQLNANTSVQSSLAIAALGC